MYSIVTNTKQNKNQQQQQIRKKTLKILFQDNNIINLFAYLRFNN